MSYRTLCTLVVIGALGLGVLAGCSDDAPESSATAATSAESTSGDALVVVASFYPLQWMAEEVGGELLDVSGLTPPGAEPHDLELTPTDVAAVADADVVVFLSGIQPAVDDAIDGARGAVFDAAGSADLSLTFTPIEEGVEATDEAGAVDPHFWLDPLRLADAADALAATMSEIDAPNAEHYAANAAELRQDLETLDDEYSAGLADCADKNLVTSHNAFGYLAQRYGMVQLGIAGLTPEEEPSPSDIAAVADFVEANDVHTIYFETLVSPAIAETIAAETGADTAVLDPIEGLSEGSEGSDFLEVMRSNLSNLRRGQSCT